MAIHKKIFSAIIILILILGIIPNVQADMPYEDVTTNVTFTVSYSMDDAYDLIGYQFRNNTTLAYLKSSSYDTYTGIIFNSTTIPVGATINHAYLSLYGSDAVDSNSYLTTVYGIDEDNCDTFAVEADLTGITQTSAFANWDLSSLEGGAWANSTDLKVIVQEIINRGGWASGNALGFRLSSAKSAYGTRSFRTYDYTGSTYDPKIYITYTVSTVISQSNPWDYISDFNDSWTLLNETNGYTWWEVWNGSDVGYFFVDYYNNNVGFINQTGLINNHHSLVSPGSSSSVVEQVGNNFQSGFTRSDGYYYFSIWNSTGGHVVKTNDKGNTFSHVLNFGWAYYGYSTYYDSVNDILHLVLGSATTIYYAYYNFATNIWSATYTVVNANSVIQVYYDGTYVYCVFSTGSCVFLKYSSDYGVSWTQVQLSNTKTGNNLAGRSVFFDDGTGTHCYTIWYWWGEFYGSLMHSDFTVSPDEFITTGANQHQIVVNLINYDIKYFYATGANIRTATRNYGTGLWSATSLITTGCFNPCQVLTAQWDTAWDKGNYTFAFDDATHRDLIHIWSGSGSNWAQIGQHDFNDLSDATERGLIGSGVTAGIHQFILLNPDGEPVDDIPDYITYQPDYFNSTYDKFLFEGEVYKIGISVNNTDITYLTLNDTVHTLTFSYNNNTDVYKLEVADADGTLVNQLVAGLISSGKTDYSGNITSIWWKFILNTNIVDCVNMDFSYVLQYTNSSSPYNILLTETGLIDANITIYNLGGIIEYTFTGDGGHTIGGHPFQIYATNSTLNSTARANIIYRRLQGVHTLVELDMDNKNDSYRLEELSNIGYFEMGIDYKLEGNESSPWIEGWMVRIYVDDINVGTNFDGLLLKDRAYINTRVLWFNRGTLIRGDEKVFSYHWAYDRDFFPSQRNTITFWVDLWFDKANSSTIFGGRVNPQYYGYTEVGSAWWFNSEFRPLTNNVTSSMLFDDVTDGNGNVVSSKQISLVRLHCKISKVASAGDADKWEVKPFQIMKMQLAKERMEGIDTPDFIETQQLNIAGYGMYNILGGVGAIISGALLGVIRLMMGSMDTFLSYFGLPYGTFSTLMNYISISFSSLMGWLASATAVFSSMLSIFSLLVTNISSFITYTIATILFFLSDIFTIPLQLVQLIIAVLNGTTITFYGILFDFTPYKDLMDALKQIMPTFGSMMFATWLVYGNVSFEGEPTIEGIMGRIKLSFEWIRDTYSGIFWIFNSIYSEILFIYAWVKSHIPTLGGTPAQAPQA